jgi:uncharacterized protein (DUF1919 family)
MMGALAKRIVASLRRRGGSLRTLMLRRRVLRQVRELDSSGVSIISNNCVAGILYEWAALPKRSPTAGLYFTALAYSDFLDDLGSNRIDRWSEIDASNLAYKDDQSCWELPLIGRGEIVFLHYSSPAEATGKWARRIQRLHGRTLLVVSSIHGGITRESLQGPLQNFRFTFTVNGDPAPPADELVLNPKFLRAFASYLDRVIGALPGGRVADEITV